METGMSGISPWAILAGVITGQVISTIWFVVLFGEPWAREYGASDKKQHTKEVPPYTYAVQILCTLGLVLSLAVLQQWLAVDTASDALLLGTVLALGLCVATGLPGQAFLKRWRVAAIALGCEVTMILAISMVLVLMA